MSLHPNQIIDTVAMLRNLPRQELIGNGRSVHVVQARHELHAALRDLTHLSFIKIGQIAGGKDHTSIVSSINRVEKLRQADPDFRAANDDLMRFLREMEPEEAAKFAAADAACTVGIARQAACNPSSLSLPEISRLGVAMLTLSSVIAADLLTDAEARRAAQQVMSSSTSPIPKGA